MRAMHRDLIKQARALVPLPRLVDNLGQGLGSKNNRTRVECIEVLAEFLHKDGLPALSRAKAKPFAAIAQVWVCFAEMQMFWLCDMNLSDSLAACMRTLYWHVSTHRKRPFCSWGY